jgi:hypothetical protein
MNCPLCGAKVKAVGKTTKHYEPTEREETIKEVLGIINNYKFKRETNAVAFYYASSDENIPKDIWKEIKKEIKRKLKFLLKKTEV